MDLFGPPSYDSLGGKKYCLVIVDDYSKYTWVYLFKKKSETQQTVIEFANEAQHQHNSKILAIRSDNGIEFKNYTLVVLNINIPLLIPLNKMVLRRLRIAP